MRSKEIQCRFCAKVIGVPPNSTGPRVGALVPLMVLSIHGVVTRTTSTMPGLVMLSQ